MASNPILRQNIGDFLFTLGFEESIYYVRMCRASDDEVLEELEYSIKEQEEAYAEYRLLCRIAKHMNGNK